MWCVPEHSARRYARGLHAEAIPSGTRTTCNVNLISNVCSTTVRYQGPRYQGPVLFFRQIPDCCPLIVLRAGGMSPLLAGDTVVLKFP